ncbi:MAG TPA: OmpA family protein [Terriglobales bacterium]|jgi:outer membrane protein OmpA-like peptidoglycan-associated protein|nr:OmpA family protein [Terriglobales bacterium]
MNFKPICCALLLIGTAGIVAAQDNSNSENENPSFESPGIQMIAETTQAVNYRKGATTAVDFKGTSLMPEFTGKAKIINKRALTDIHVDVEHLQPAKSLDLAYLTYVLWAISPEGQAKNIGELVPHDGKASLHTTTDLQAFALVITAEPDFAVSHPSEMIVGENTLRSTTQGQPEAVDVHYQAFRRAAYVSQVNPVQNSVYGEDKKAPLDLLEARNAVRIARDAHAEQYAPEMLDKAEKLLDQAEDYYRRKQGSKPIATVAREAVQTAEEARVNSVRSEEQARIERQRRENEARTEQARAEAKQAEQQAERAKQQAAEAQLQAQQAQQQAQVEAQQRAAAEQQQQEAAAQAQQAQQQAQQQTQEAQQQAQQAQQQAQEEAQKRAEAEQQQQQAAQQAEEARQRAEQAEQRNQQLEVQQAQVRQQLMSQLNQVLQTHDSARGLIVSMPDLLFSTASADLKAAARERLAKVAGILIAYPDIHVEVDGYTDSTGSVTFNEQLSQQRAASVQSYLVQQGVPSSSIDTHGFGQANPVASNDTATGRQQNRRVELVVSGNSIGTQQATQ